MAVKRICSITARPRWLKTSTAHRLIAVVVSVSLSTFALEAVLRVQRGQLLEFESLTAESPDGPRRVAYDQTLGWLPTRGQRGSDPVYNVTPSGFRNNGGSSPLAGPPVLAVGDSFTFGDEVNDGETWAVQLEGMLSRRVLNAGVPAYGIDQAVLRAEPLLDEYRPSVVILAFISDDISRTEYDYYPYGRGWKPYFELVNGALQLRNTPVPTTPAPRRFPVVRHALGYSRAADAVLSRTAFRWWRNVPPLRQVHGDGERVSVELLVRLDGS